MVFMKILYLLIFIFIQNQSFAADWRPNQVGSFLSSKFARSITDIDKAAYYAQYSYSQNTAASGLGIIALEALLANGQIKEAIPIGIKISNEVPEITLAQYLKVLDSLDSNNFNKTLELLRKVSPNGIDTYILPILQTWAAAGSNQQTGGLQIIKDQAERGVLEPIYDYHSALINEFIGNSEAAKINYSNIIKKSNNANAQVYLSAAEFFKRNNNQGLLDKTIAKLERLKPYSNELFLLKNSNVSPSKKINNVKDGIAEIFLNSAEILFNEGLDRQALIYGQIALYLSPNLDSASYLLGKIFRSINNNERAVKYLKNVKDNSSIFYDAKITYAEIIYDIEGTEKSFAILNKLHKLHPENINLSRSIAELFYKSENFDKSIEYYDLIFSKIEKIEFKHWPLFYSSGIALERGKKWERAEKQFLMALKFVPDNPQVLNYLGYSWIDQGININAAMEMIVKAAEQRPSDGYIIDSLGWAFYQIGQYEEAVIKLEKAVELTSDSIIIDHLGDALFYSGRKIEAVFQWKRALEFEPSEEMTNKIKEKIEGTIIPKAGINAASKPI
jgi:tetratricopeptide (TPR) repeat protein|tara:strand:- start:7525 stop:9204 length:1680 start_codon:yes stop_codon:yes gene_type:complete